MPILTMGRSMLAIGATAVSLMRADGQVIKRAPAVPASPIAPMTAVAAFHNGLVASALPLANPGPSPLADATLSWRAYPGASGYQVLRQVRLSPTEPWSSYVVVASDLGSGTTSYTARGLAPGWYVQIRIVATVGGMARDTSNPAPIQTPAAAIRSAFQPYFIETPLPTTYRLANVLPKQCASGQIAGSVQGFVRGIWARNPAATGYTVALIQTTSPNTPSLLPLVVVSDTQATVPVPSSTRFAYLFVRPDFRISNWPVAGQTYTVLGQVTYLGAAHPPSAVPCTEVQ